MRRIRGHVHDQLRRVRHARHRHLRRLCRHVPVRSTSGGSRGARPRHCPYGEAARSGRPRPTAPTRRPLSRLTASAGYRPRVRAPTSSLTKGALAAGARLASMPSAWHPHARSPRLALHSSPERPLGSTVAWRSRTRTPPDPPTLGPHSKVRARSSSEHCRTAESPDVCRRAAPPRRSPATPGATTTDSSPKGSAPSPPT